MSELKTQPTSADVEEFIASVDHPQRRADAEALLEIFAKITNQPPIMWGPSIIGYGTYKYKTKDGKEHEFMRGGFSPRKQNMSVYVGAAMSADPNILDGLGKYKTGKSCLYFTQLKNIDQDKLEQIIRADVEEMNKRYPE